MKDKRIHLIDILRGFALIGILLINSTSIARMINETQLDRQIWKFMEYGVRQRFFPIFCFLFGYGFYIFMHNAERKRLSPYGLMARRLVLLILFGIAHQFIQPGEALLPYGIFGFALLPMYKRSPIVVLLAAIAITILGISASEFLIIPALFLFGLYLGKIDYFNRLDEYRQVTKIVWVVSLILIVPLNWLQAQLLITDYYFSAQSSAGLSMGGAMVTSLILWSKTERLLQPIANFGRMALTNYIMQSIIVLLIALIFGGYGVLHTYSAPILWILIWPVQVVFSNHWLARFHYGPLEWLWRWGTYGTIPAFRKELAHAI